MPHDMMPKCGQNVGKRWMCNGARGCGTSGKCVPTDSPCAPYKSECECKMRCDRQRYTCVCGPGNSTQIVASESGEFYSYEDAVRNGCGKQCTPSGFLGSYVGSEVYHPNCSSNNNCEGCCNIAKVNKSSGCGKSVGGGSRYGQASCGGYGMGIGSGMQSFGACRVGGEPLGPCVRGLDSNVLIAADNQIGCGGFEGILIDRPRDLMWADGISDDPTVLTNNRNQTRDLRGDILNGLVNSCCEKPNCGGCDKIHRSKCSTGIVGPFCGTLLPGIGPFTGADPCRGAGVRQFIY